MVNEEIKTEIYQSNSFEIPVFTLETTLTNEPAEYAGMTGQCLFDSCQCKFFAGLNGECGDCKHGNLYHLVRPHREDVAARQAEINRSKQLFTKRAAREAREREAKRLADEASKPTNIPVNNFPCSVNDCECAKFTASTINQTINQLDESTIDQTTNQTNDSSLPSRLTISTDISLPSINTSRISVSSPNNQSNSQSNNQLINQPLNQLINQSNNQLNNQLMNQLIYLPKICKKCKHAEMYHIKLNEDEKKKGKNNQKSPKKKK